MPESAAPNQGDLLDRLKRIDRNQFGDGYDQAVLSIYQLYVEMADRVSERRQSANSFYLSINTVFLGAFAVFGGSKLGPLELLIVSIAGIALCFMWRQNIHSYRDLNSGKFAVINAIEELLPIAPYETEWEILGRGTRRAKYRPFHEVERVVPYVFMTIYAIVLGTIVPWPEVIDRFCGRPLNTP